MRFPALFFAALAVAGLALSILSHLAALVGKPGPLGDYEWLLHAGIFVVWLPAVLISGRITRDFKRKDVWKAALRGCPPWMRYMVYGFFVYALVNFAVFIASAPTTHRTGPMPPSVVRGFSGHWMAFYSAAAALLYSAAHVRARDERRTCVQGHTVGALAQFCEQCGQPVIEASPHRQP